MNITIKTNMDKIPTHCGECDFSNVKGCQLGKNNWPFVTYNIHNKTLHPDCPIVRPEAEQLKHAFSILKNSSIEYEINEVVHDDFWKLVE